MIKMTKTTKMSKNYLKHSLILQVTMGFLFLYGEVTINAILNIFYRQVL